MADRIYIEGLAIPCTIGVFDWERKVKQKIVIDLDFAVSLQKPARTDKIKDAVDYNALSKRIVEFVKKSRYQLIETLADQLAKVLIKDFPLPELHLRVSKPGAIRGAKNVGVELWRKRKIRKYP